MGGVIEDAEQMRALYYHFHMFQLLNEIGFILAKGNQLGRVQRKNCPWLTLLVELLFP